MRYLIVSATALLLSGCQTWGPTWSEITGNRYSDMPSMTESPVLINQLDGTTPIYTARDPIKATPGKHQLVLQAVPPPSVMGSVYLEQIDVDLQPCKRYYINARFASPTSTSWKAFVEQEEVIPGCQATPKAN
jgi:hypothetical protein